MYMSVCITLYVYNTYAKYFLLVEKRGENS